MRAAVIGGQVPKMAALVARGASLTATLSGGSTFSHLAAVEGDHEVSVLTNGYSRTKVCADKMMEVFIPLENTYLLYLHHPRTPFKK